MPKINQFISSAPANTLLMGEHSVVYGQPALVVALPPRIKIHWQARDDQIIEIQSSLAHYRNPLSQLDDHPQLRFVLAALRLFQPQLTTGWTLKIDSEFPSDWGLGSSAAVLAACLVALEKITHQDSNLPNLSLWQRFRLGHQIIQQVQGRGSGADLAASLAGGGVLFDPSQQLIEPLGITHPLCLVYSGYKTPTPEVLAWVAEQWQHRPDQLNSLYQAMGDTTRQAYQALKQNNWTQFYSQVDHYQGLMQQLGVSDPTLEQIHQQLKRSLPAAKISGSGLGDCVLGFGHINHQINHPLLNTEISHSGAYCQAVQA
ncbi:mevalonate kinase family protein [Thiomicrospira microaerophila]|uniref:mevalonate kinase family protein n=1 Tax=Thiomicrospira microaerophila TaxID=406020 RepID=UPI000697F970|nr:hypothetical protein [Thiomicrospira microaerophila]